LRKFQVAAPKHPGKPELSLLKRIAILLLLAPTVVIAVLWIRAYSPSEVETAAVSCADDAPLWDSTSQLKVMSYNVQYMASKNYVFFYDVDTDNADRVAAVERLGKTLASHPSQADILWTLDEVANLISAEEPDVVLLQEVNGAEDSRTYYTDHVAELLDRLPAGTFPCVTSAPYWQAEFIFHPQVLGPVNMQLATLSRYRISHSVRHQLPRKANNFLVRPFDFQRALLETHIAADDDTSVAVINTHYEAWAAGTGLMEKQVAKTQALLEALDDQGTPWILGGDLNLLPPDDNRQRQRIVAAGTGNYDENPQIQLLYDSYRGIPSLQHLRSGDPRAWYTHFPNDPTVAEPDRTIDYQFYSDQWLLDEAYIIQDYALEISDHLPVVGNYSLPKSSREEASAR
jgi:endonuclease/exonuclease/phosphatase family metal-dependent hydrolase